MIHAGYFMKQLLLEKGKVKPFEVPVPQCRPNNILVKVHYSFISKGTESSTISESGKSIISKCFTNASEKINKIVESVKNNGISGTVSLVKNSLNKLMPLGYSCSGKIIATGSNIQNFKIGDFVACAGTKIANHAEYISVPQNLSVKIINKEFLKQSSITTIGAIALQGIRRANLKLGENVCIIGLGLIGQLTVQLAKLSGCKVFGIDIDNSKLELAKKLGCNFTYNSLETNPIKEIEFHSQHCGVDSTIITAASKDGNIIQQAMEITRKKGKVILVGDVKIDFPRSPFYEKEIDFCISCSYGPGRYDQSYENAGNDYPYSYVRWTENRNMQLISELICDRKLKIDPLISQEFSINKFENAYESLQNKKYLGAILSYPETGKPILQSKQKFEKPKTIKLYKKPTNKINVAFIGAGGFAKIKLLPIISKIKNVKIHTIIDTDQTNALNIQRQYDAENFTNNYKEILENENIHTVIISTPHFLHTDQAINCIKHGKAVFVEKPAAVNFEQLDQLKKFLKNINGYAGHTACIAPYCVDFNRSFAPFITKTKSVVSNRSTPMVINYRMNSGFIAKNHWIQSEKNGGRIIGEACHIFELFNFLTESKVKNISAKSINTESNDLVSSDNFCTQLSYENGSICNLIYTSVGNTEMNKELMEIFFDGKSIIINDYKELIGYGFSKSFNEKIKYPDKGHQNLISKFFESAKNNTQLPISIERILEATKTSLKVNEATKII